MRRLNILISSTQQWNPGDELICNGVKNLIRAVTGTEHNWLLWNRNPDLFVNQWCDGHQKPGLLTNSLREPQLEIIDLVVLAGTPEWTGQPVESIYKSLLKYPETPVLVLGVGSGSPDIQLTRLESAVLWRENACITTRSHELTYRLSTLLKLKQIATLPCPALFCGPRISEITTARQIGFVLQNSAVNNQSIDDRIVTGCLASIYAANGKKHRNDKIEIVCFYINEFLRFGRASVNGGNVKCRYSYKSDDLLELLSKYGAIISTRLHGAIAGLSLGLPSALVVSDDNFRIRSAQQPFNQVLPIMNSKQAIEYFDAMTDAGRKAAIEKIVAFKSQTFAAYISILKDFFVKNSLT